MKNNDDSSPLGDALVDEMERDVLTERHGSRVQKVLVHLAKSIKLPKSNLTDLLLLAQFHDIGKVEIPDFKLFKPGLLTLRERLEMQKHCEIGYRIAQSSPDLIPIGDLILKHHEWWNGGGYPLALQGKDIPIECRILSIMDAYDAMISDRPYRDAQSHEEALEEIKRFAGTQFDPDLVDNLLRVLN